MNARRGFDYVCGYRLQDSRNDAFAIQVGDRWFWKFDRGRLFTAHHLAGACLFVHSDAVDDVLARIKKRRRERRRITLLTVHSGAVLISATPREMRASDSLAGWVLDA